MGPMALIVHLLGLLLVGALATGASAAAWGLFSMGQSAHWRSDGPGILLVMIFTAVFGMIALGLWAWFLSGVFRGSREVSDGA